MACHWLGPGLEAAVNLSPIPASATLMAAAVYMARSLRDLALLFGRPEDPEVQLGPWAPGSLSDDGWAGSGDLALRAPPAEICPFSRAWAMAGGPRRGAAPMLPAG